MIGELATGILSVAEADEQRYEAVDNGWYSRLKNADAETMEGYIIFGGGAEVNIFEPEKEIPF